MTGPNCDECLVDDGESCEVCILAWEAHMEDLAEEPDEPDFLTDLEVGR